LAHNDLVDTKQMSIAHLPLQAIQKSSGTAKEKATMMESRMPLSANCSSTTSPFNQAHRLSSKFFFRPRLPGICDSQHRNALLFHPGKEVR
jgi:hypothetical protein